MIGKRERTQKIESGQSGRVAARALTRAARIGHGASGREGEAREKGDGEGEGLRNENVSVEVGGGDGEVRRWVRTVASVWPVRTRG